MISFQNLLREEFIQKKDYLESLKTNRINSSKEFIIWAETKINELHNWLKEHQFDNEQEEILFFKEIKPSIISKLIFQKAVLQIELNTPKGKSQCNKYYEDELIKHSEYPLKDIKFYHYYRSGSTDFDNIYFTRASKKNIFETECFQIISDHRLSTCFDFKIARIIASGELVQYIEKQLFNLNKSPEINDSNTKSKFNWTGTKVDITEVVYAFQATGCINYGNFDLKELAHFLGTMLNIEIDSNLYGNYSDIKSRKVSKTRFIISMSEKLIEKMDNEDSKKKP